MVKKKITPLLLAASMLVCTYTSGFTHTQSASAITRVDELSDVQESNWAYDSLKDLVEKYNVVEGYPDKTFRGAKFANRYELAAALNATIKAIGKDIARLGAEKADKEDLAKVAKLQQEFASELMAINARTQALEARATKIEAKNDEQDNRLAVMEKMKIYGDVNLGGLADMSAPGGFRDGITTIGRVRTNLDYGVVEDKGGPIVGPGTIHTRLVAAFGRVAPIDQGNTGSTSSSLFSGYSAIAQDASAFNQGISTSNTNPFIQNGTNVRAGAYLDSAYYSQVLRASLPYMPKDDSWRTSFIGHAGLIPWRDIYCQSPYYGNENTQFQNIALINNMGILNNNTVPRIALQMRQGLGRYANAKLTSDFSTLDVSDAMNGGIALTVEGDLGYNLGFLNNMLGTKNIFNVSGDAFAGYEYGWTSGTLNTLALNNVANANALNSNITPAATTLNPATNPLTGTAGTPLPVSQKNFDSLYAGINQEIYKGWGAFGTYSLNDTGSTAALFSALQTNTGNNIILNSAGGANLYGVKQAWTIGTELPIKTLPKFLTFGKRQRDIFGVAYAQIMPTSTYSVASAGAISIGNTAVSSERLFEAYYKAQVTDGFSIIPSVQLIFDRAGNKANAADIAVGIRSSFTF